jgi:hypothetical protein
MLVKSACSMGVVPIQFSRAAGQTGGAITSLLRLEPAGRGIFCATCTYLQAAMVTQSLFNACKLSLAISSRVGQNHIYVRCIYGVWGREFTTYTVFLASKSPYIRSNTVHVHGSGQPYKHSRAASLARCQSELCTHLKLFI